MSKWKTVNALRDYSHGFVACMRVCQINCPFICFAIYFGYSFTVKIFSHLYAQMMIEIGFLTAILKKLMHSHIYFGR